LNDSNEQKIQANAQFASGHYKEAIDTYNEAIKSCPIYLHFEVAVLHSNIAASQLKLKDWKEAVTAASKSLDCLEKLVADKKIEEKAATDDGDEEIEEIQSPMAKARAPKASEDIDRLKAKALMRRGKARSELGGWSALSSAEEGEYSRLVCLLNFSDVPSDYKALSKMASLSTADMKIVRQQLNSLPGRLSKAKEEEVGEMMGKLKELGNGILKPFGLSTNNFNFVKDPTTGGYSMGFDQGNGSA
jgi:tetratricopeptide (TPR) repeat protein